MRVLVAEDDRVISHLVCSLLRGRGFTPVQAVDAMQALMLAKRPPVPDVIILDLNMPGGNGVETLKRLKTASMTSLIPVVVLSGDESAAQTVLDLGAAAFLPKPVVAETLFAAIAEALGTSA